MMSSNEFHDHVEIIADRLYWVTSAESPTGITSFNVDNRIRYIRYSKDFGPVSLAAIVNFCRVVRKNIAFDDDSSKSPKNPVYFHSSIDPEKRANAALLIACFQLLVLKRTSDEIWMRINGSTILPFRDASYNDKCQYKCTILDCLQALEISMKFNWFSLDSFSIPEFEALENSVTGNMSIVVPARIIACRGPVDDHQEKQSSVDSGESHARKEAKHPGVSTSILIQKLKALASPSISIVRCNSPEDYDRLAFTSAGFNHFDLLFSDGSCPTYDIIQSFTRVVDEAKGYVVVHCKAGLGRTGTLIACYMMKKYQLTARQAIAWIRLCRSGSVLGKQQVFLLKYEDYLVSKGFYHGNSSLKDRFNLSKPENKLTKQQGKENENSITEAKHSPQSSSKASEFIVGLFQEAFYFREGNAKKLEQTIRQKQQQQQQVKQYDDTKKNLSDQTAIISPAAGVPSDESYDISRQNNQDISNVFTQKVFFTEEKRQAEGLLQLNSKQKQSVQSALI